MAGRRSLTPAHGTLTTDSSGRATRVAFTPTPGTYTVCVTSVTKAGSTYDPAANVETCDGVSIP